MAYLFRTKRKDGKHHPRWRFQYTDFQGRRRTATGTTSKAETEKIAAQVQAKEDGIRKGWRDAPKSSDKPRSYDETVSVYLDWGRAQGGRGGRPWGETHARMRRTHLEWWRVRLGLALLSDLEAILPKVEKALRELQDAGRSGKTLQNYAEALAAFCGWCQTRGYLASDPLTGLAGFDTTPRTRRRAMTTEELGCLLAACSPRRRMVYEMAFSTGLRAKELRNLTVGHLDLMRGGLHLHAAWTKNRKPGFQPMPHDVIERLLEAVRGKDKREPLLYVPSHTARDLDKDLKAAGIRKWTPEGKLDFHAARTAYATFVLEEGASVKEAQVLLRHSTPDLTMNVYGRARVERLSEVADKVGKTLFSVHEDTTIAQRKAVGDGTLSHEKGYAERDAGSIPAASTILPGTESGPRVTNPGPFSLEAGHPQELTKSTPCKGRTETAVTEPQHGPAENTISAQQEHNISITAEGLPDDLPPDVLAGLRNWHKLPEHIRTAVEALLKGSVE